MTSVSGGRVPVRADDDPLLLTMIVVKKECSDGKTLVSCQLTTGEECEPVTDDSWRIKATGQVLHRVSP